MPNAAAAVSAAVRGGQSRPADLWSALLFLWHGTTARCVDLRSDTWGCGNAVSLQDYLQLAVTQIQLV